MLQSVNGPGSSLGVAGLGTVFFAVAGGPAGFVLAAEVTLLGSIAVLAVAFLVCFLLPDRRAQAVTAEAERLAA